MGLNDRDWYNDAIGEKRIEFKNPPKNNDFERLLRKKRRKNPIKWLVIAGFFLAILAIELIKSGKIPV